MAIIVFFIGFIAVLISAFYISFNVYATLNSRGNKLAALASIIAFVVSLIGLGVIVLFVWAELTGGFSRR
ncbi:hypothetical protein [Cytophaga hutchinsonii]|uniref:Uncharacterized protein n=1 Tax=Cytophaga hutchinsonii (strain ATCC 33406 / DSM 1761 / CIP 103989 / NBRC 15051 / NCIMB 9469 / D465) TaxID=269798 RepID=A0A6N4SXA3_CYTH3|nr:hypothetical protein [Cytophaga hutchinsonii]ABG61038.1 hypothetical protein CHU_3806 [Cytophaga hutchinsonii ATCC 33406]SFX44889.1 hypothetical protein SAMN04487930_104153 [Cytophaga hutchinsonii ATCC 33406]